MRRRLFMRKKFCAHRGVSALMPENTLPAFGAALALGADEIEFDVRLTKDQQLIVSHDGTLERISNGCGQLSEFTLAELKELNLEDFYKLVYVSSDKEDECSIIVLTDGIIEFVIEPEAYLKLLNNYFEINY